MNKLSIRVDVTSPSYPLVRLFVDGRESLTSTGETLPNDPADLLDTGALLPVDPPRRIAFYGCGCSDFGCSNVVRLVCAARPEARVHATFDGTGVSINHQLDPPRCTSTDLALPSGPVDRLAEALIELLDRGIDPRQIAGRRLWR